MECHHCEPTKDSDAGRCARDRVDNPAPILQSVHHCNPASILEEFRANSIAPDAEIECVGQLKVQHQAILSPIQNLPPEIMSHIFHFELKGEEGRDYWTELVKATAVCRKWRAVALETPRLWANYKMQDRPSQSLLLSSQCWLARSRNAPLNASLILEEPHKGFLDTYLPPLLARLRKISVLNLAHGDDNKLFSFLREAPQLRALDLLDSIDKSRRNMEKGRPIPLLFLQRLKLSGASGLPALHCPSLVSLKLRDIRYSADDFRVLSSGAPMLTLVALSHCSRENEPEQERKSAPALHPSLQKLKLNVSESSLVLDFIRSPNLRQLGVWINPSWNDVPSTKLNVPFPPLNHLVRLKLDLYCFFRSRCSNGLEASELGISWLEQALEIKELVISVTSGRVLFPISSIISVMIDRNLCPSLRSFTIKGSFRDLKNTIRQFLIQRPKCSLTLRGGFNLPDVNSAYRDEFEAAFEKYNDFRGKQRDSSDHS